MNPISLRRNLKVICMSAGCMVPTACGWLHTKAPGESGYRTASMKDALTCNVLQNPGSSSEVVTPGNSIVTIKFPDSNPVAILQVPQRAVSDPTTFVLNIETGVTSRALINITAHQGLNNITTFSGPLRLTLFVRGGCTPPRPSPGSTFYVYTMQVNAAGNDTSLVEGHGKYVGGSGSGGDHVEAELKHLSGYILAQGIIR